MFPDAVAEVGAAQVVRVVAPFCGEVTLLVSVGDTVEAGQVLGTLEAVKLEAPITAPSAGTVVGLGPVRAGAVQGGELVAVLCRPTLSAG